MRIHRKIAGPFIALFLAIPLSFAVLNTGDTFIPFSLTNIDGREYMVTMEEGRLTLIVSENAGGEVRVDKSHPDAVLLDFWATWCVPCRKAMPHMQELHDKFKPAPGQDEGGLRLFGIAIDEKGSRVVKPFYEKLKITYPMLADPTAGGPDDPILRSAKDMKSRYKVQEIPVVYLIDAKGKITHVHVGFKEEHIIELDAAVTAILGGGNS